MPNEPAALATAAVAAGSKRSMLPIGASATGMVNLRFRNVALVSVTWTLRRMRGRNASESMASRLRRTVEQRMNDLGAPPDVAVAIARAGRPWSLVASVVMLATVLVVTWHHLRA